MQGVFLKVDSTLDCISLETALLLCKKEVGHVWTLKQSFTQLKDIPFNCLCVEVAQSNSQYHLNGAEHRTPAHNLFLAIYRIPQGLVVVEYGYGSMTPAFQGYLNKILQQLRQQLAIPLVLLVSEPVSVPVNEGVPGEIPVFLCSMIATDNLADSTTKMNESKVNVDAVDCNALLETQALSNTDVQTRDIDELESVWQQISVQKADSTTTGETKATTCNESASNNESSNNETNIESASNPSTNNESLEQVGTLYGMYEMLYGAPSATEEETRPDNHAISTTPIVPTSVTSTFQSSILASQQLLNTFAVLRIQAKL